MRSRAARRLALLGALALALAPSSATAAECAGDECQGPPPAPEEVIPGTAVIEGPSNPPVRFPAHHKKHHHVHRKAKR